MNNIIVDTNPLVYIYHNVSNFGKKYANLLGELSKNNVFIIPKIVYGELSLIFQKPNELDSFLSDTGIIIGEINSRSYITAAKRWQKYNKRRILTCYNCGTKLKTIKCSNCKCLINIRQHILADFLIGAFALENPGKKLVTEDHRYYSTYFPELNIISSTSKI